jgi:hypothetical protein
MPDKIYSNSSMTILKRKKFAAFVVRDFELPAPFV